jgi:glycerol kinase
LESAQADTAMTIETLRIDGGMSANPTFVTALADASGRPVEVSPVTEATTLGAAYLAGIALGMWADEDDVAAAWKPALVVEPRSSDAKRSATRARWLAARERALGTVPELSALEF